MNSVYEKHSTEAKELEADRQFRKAGKEWVQAAKAARNPDNVSWCKARAELCKRKHR